MSNQDFYMWWRMRVLIRSLIVLTLLKNHLKRSLGEVGLERIESVVEMAEMLEMLETLLEALEVLETLLEALEVVEIGGTKGTESVAIMEIAIRGVWRIWNVVGVTTLWLADSSWRALGGPWLIRLRIREQSCPGVMGPGSWRILEMRARKVVPLNQFS